MILRIVYRKVRTGIIRVMIEPCRLARVDTPPKAKLRLLEASGD